jgi:hypothetical protein
MRRLTPEIFAALFAGLIVCFALGVPLMDDDLFWWTPKALLVAESGPSWVLSGELPASLLPELDVPRQWEGGLPDYGHPPLWFWWLGAWLKVLGASARSVHLAVLPVALATGWGLAALLRRMGGVRAAWTASAILICPPIVAQLWRGDTDVGLLALTTWALVALMDGRWARFAVLGALATWVKEPGVLLVVPAIVACRLERRFRWQAVVPLAALLAWGLLHKIQAGWAFAGAERIPENLISWITDIGAVTWLVLGAQGRFLIWPFAAWGIWKAAGPRRGAWIVGSFTLVQIGFFGSINFLGGVERADSYTHVRYLGPGLSSGAAVGVAANPWAAVPLSVASLWNLKKAHKRGPEASLCGAETALALRAFHEAVPSVDGPLWVGSYAYAQLTRPVAGVVKTPRLNLMVFGPDTVPEVVSGHVLHAAYGEPLGRLQELGLEEVGRWSGRCGWVALEKVQSRSNVTPGVPPVGR